MKRLLAVFLSICLLFSIISINVAASTPINSDIILSAVVTQDTVYPGQTFTINIDISNNSGIYTWRADLSYDSDVFQFIGCSSTNDFTEEDNVPRFSYHNTDGNIRMLWDASGNSNFTKNGTIASIQFKVKSDVTYSDYLFDLDVLDATKVITEKPYAQPIIITSNDSNTNVEQIRISKVEIADLDVKDEYYIGEELSINSLTLKATYNNGDVENITTGYTTAYDFSSSGEKTVTVNYNGCSTTFKVTVVTPSIALSDTSKIISVGQTYNLVATTLPADVTVIWKSDNENAATVKDGLVTAVAEGKATITASFVYKGFTYEVDCVITSELLLGDINFDGVVDTSDLAIMKLYLVGKSDLTEKELASANVSQNGEVDTTDLALLKLFLAGKFSSFKEIEN